MGSGKSTLGRLLAKALNIPHVDTDRLIEQQTGVDIPTIFDIEGEAGFRQREEKILSDVIENFPQIISTGGGIVLNEKNRQLLKEHTYGIYLLVPLDQLMKRLSGDTQRPLLQTPNPRERLLEILKERDNLYRQAAQWVLPTDHLSVMKVKHILQTQLMARGIITYETPAHSPTES